MCQVNTTRGYTQVRSATLSVDRGPDEWIWKKNVSTITLGAIGSFALIIIFANIKAMWYGRFKKKYMQWSKKVFIDRNVMVFEVSTSIPFSS
jgi:hypothetical protein